MIEILLIFALLAFILKRPSGVLACGIVGFSGKTSYNLDKIKFLMLWNSVERGRDATGIFTPETGIIKLAEPASKFFRSKDILKLKEDSTIIAHVRAKTVGNNTVNNTHPFNYGETVLVHNGTLDNYMGQTGLAAKYDIKYADYDVDSQILAIAINKAFEKKEEDLNLDILSEYQGAAALLFYNKSTDLLYAYHDSKRPLFRGWDKDGNMYISSIQEALESVDVFSIESFAENTVFAIKNGEVVSEKKYLSYEELHPKKVEKINNHHNRNNHHHHNSMGGTTSKKKFPKLERGQRGFKEKEKNFEPWMLIGFNIRAKYTVTINKNSSKGEYLPYASIIEGDWYLVTGYFYSASSVNYDGFLWLEIIDKEGNEAQLIASALDYSYYIPKKGDSVKFVKNVVAAKDSDRIFEANDLAIIDDYDVKQEGYYIKDKSSSIKWLIPAKLIRLLTPTELALMSIKVNDKETNIELLLEGIDKESPFKEQEIINNYPEESNDEQEDVEEKGLNNESADFVDIDIYYTFVDIIQKEITKLEEKYDCSQDITSNINEIKAKIAISSDFEYLSSIQKTV